MRLLSKVVVGRQIGPLLIFFQMNLFRRAFLVSCLGGILFCSTGCTTAVIAGAAAAGGYIAHENGYRLRNPVTRNSSRDDSNADGK